MKKKILLTRPKASSERWAALLERHGYESVIEPLLIIRPTHSPRPEGPFQAIFITSANAVDALQDIKIPLSDILFLPCYCVGSSTADAARAFGFTDIRCGTSDGATLAQMAAKDLKDTNRAILHIAGDVVDGRAQEVLLKSGLTLISWIVYQACRSDDFTPALKDLFAKGGLAAILVFSTRSAHILTSLIEKNHLTTACSSLIAVALSQGVADVLQTLPWQSLHVANSPDKKDVLAGLELAMTQSETHTTPLPSPIIHTQKKFGVWPFFLIPLMAVVLALALIRCPYLQPLLLSIDRERNSADNKALEERVGVLEGHVKTLTEIPPAPQDTFDVTNLTDTIKNLESRVAQLEAKGSGDQLIIQKFTSASFTLFDLREAARSGQNFTPQLAALRTLIGPNPIVSEQLSKLESFAAMPPLTLSQLHENLLTAEISLPSQEKTPYESWQEHVKTLLRPLISVHPLHNPSLNSLDEALTSGNVQAAEDAYKALPDDTQKNLSSWHEKFLDRLTLDLALQDLTTHFTPNPLSGNAP